MQFVWPRGDGTRRVTKVDRYVAGSGTPDPCRSLSMDYDIDYFGDVSYGNYVLGRLSSVSWGNKSQAICQAGGFTEFYNYNRSGAVNRKSLYLERGDVWAELLSSFAFDTAGRVHWYQLPSTEPPNANGVDDQYAYSLDALGQPLALSRMEYENGWYQRTVSVASATYGPAGQINSMTYGGYTETRTHNAWGQMTRMTGSGGGMPSIDLEYYFSATANNGRITGMRDHATGEQVSYSYDGWNRLSAATSTGGAAWGLSFTYDGFGNRTGQAVTSGSGPTSSLVIDGQKNRIVGTGYQYDLNGNLIAMPGMPAMSYDVENRLQTVGTDTYVYGPTMSGCARTVARRSRCTVRAGRRITYAAVDQDGSRLSRGEYIAAEQHHVVRGQLTARGVWGFAAQNGDGTFDDFIGLQSRWVGEVITYQTFTATMVSPNGYLTNVARPIMVVYPGYLNGPYFGVLGHWITKDGDRMNGAWGDPKTGTRNCPDPRYNGLRGGGTA